jgi:hypothetical protein
MKGFNAPGRYDRSPALLQKLIQQETDQSDVSFGFATEVEDDDRAAALIRPGWTVTQGNGKGKGESAILTKDSKRVVVYHDILQLTAGDGKARLANPLYAPVVITKAPSGRKTLFTICHLPAHVETAWRAIPFSTRVKASLLLKYPHLSPVVRTYVLALLSWKHQVMTLAAEHGVDDIVVGADWNLSKFAKWVRHFIDNAWPGLNIVATKGPDLGKRNIGWLLTTMTKVSASTHSTPASDHNVDRFELRHLNPPTNQPKPKVPPPPHQLCTYNGVKMDQADKLRVQILEQGELKSLAPLTIYQGDYNVGGVSASAGTHDRGGVLDFSPFEHYRKVMAWRKHFGPAWHRVAISGLWGEHIHVVAAKGGNLAPAAGRQVVAYYQGKDGLAAGARDPNPYHPQVEWDYRAEWKKINR